MFESNCIPSCNMHLLRWLTMVSSIPPPWFVYVTFYQYHDTGRRSRKETMAANDTELGAVDSTFSFVTMYIHMYEITWGARRLPTDVTPQIEDVNFLLIASFVFRNPANLAASGHDGIIIQSLYSLHISVTT